MGSQKHSPQRTQSSAELSIGDRVDYHAIVGRPATSKGHRIKAIEKEPNAFGCDVAWITEKTGCVGLDALSLTIDSPLLNSAPSAVKSL